MDSIFEDIKREFNINSQNIDYIRRKLLEKRRKIQKAYKDTEYLDTENFFKINTYLDRLDQFKLKKSKTYRAIRIIHNHIEKRKVLYGIILSALSLLVAVIVGINQISANEKVNHKIELKYESSFRSTIIEENINKYPNNQVVIANRYRDLFEYDKAIEYTTKGLQFELEQESPVLENIIYIKSSLGALYFLVGDFENALKLYTDVEQIADNDMYLLGRVYFNMAQVYSQLNDNDNAKKYYLKSYELLPNTEYYVPLMCELVAFNLDYGTEEKAVFCLDEAKKVYESIPDKNKTKYNIEIAIAEAELLSHSTEFKRSNEILNNVALDNKDILRKIRLMNLQSYNNIGLRDYSEADKLNKECSKLFNLYFPNHKSLLYIINYNKIEIKLRQKNEREAKLACDELLDKFQKNSIHSISYYINISSLFLWSGMDEYAINIMQSLNDNYLDSAMLIKKYAYLSTAYNNNREYKKAINSAQNAINISIESGIDTEFTYISHLTLCMSYQDNGDINAALSECEKIINEYKLEYGNFINDTVEENQYKVNDAIMDSENVELLGTSSINYLIQDIYKKSGLPENDFYTWWMTAYNNDMNTKE